METHHLTMKKEKIKQKDLCTKKKEKLNITKHKNNVFFLNRDSYEIKEMFAKNIF